MGHRMGFARALALLALTGCAHVNNPAGMSAGFVGCPPEEIVITDDHTLGSAPFYWTATCRGERFYCSAASEAVSCAPELIPERSSASADTSAAETSQPRVTEGPCAVVQPALEECVGEGSPDAAVLIDGNGRVTEIVEADQQTRGCLANRLVDLSIPPPGMDVSCSLP